MARDKELPKPDLAHHTLMHFLDKFVYRNPKTEESKRGGSIMQPILASGSTSHIVTSTKASARQQPTVNSSSFWNLRPDQVSAEDVFFHEYFSRIGKPAETSRGKKTATNDQVASDGEAAEEEEIWDALVNSHPEIEGVDVEEDSDVDMKEYDYSDNDVEADDFGADDQMSGSEDDGGFEGIFDDSDGSDGADASGGEDGGETKDKPTAASSRPHRGKLSRKEIRNLPTFASADDYADMLAAEDGLDD